MVVFLSRLYMPVPGSTALTARCGNCQNVFYWYSHFWHEKEELPKKEQCSECNEWNRFVKRLNTVYKPNYIRSSYGDDA